MSAENNSQGRSQIPEDLKISHDGYFQETFRTKRLAVAFLKKMLPCETLAALDLSRLVIETRHLTDDLFTTALADVVYRVPIKDTDDYVSFFVVIEHKSWSDRLTIFQLWGYVFRICLQEYQSAEKRNAVRADYQLPPVVAIIVHHGRSAFQGKTELAELFTPLPGLEAFFPKLKAILFDLNTIADDDPVLNDPAVPELKVALTVLKAVFRQDVAVTVNDVVRALKPVSDDPVIRRIIRATWVYLVNSAQYLKNNAEPLLETFQNVVGGQMMQTMAEVWKAEGEIIGVLKGKAEGEAIGVLKGKVEGEAIGVLKGKVEGKAEGKAEAVLRILARQQGPVPPSLAERIRAITNIERLDELFELAFDCKSLKEFSDHLS